MTYTFYKAQGIEIGNSPEGRQLMLLKPSLAKRRTLVPRGLKVSTLCHGMANRLNTRNRGTERAT